MECELKGGAARKLIVTPEVRHADVVVTPLHAAPVMSSQVAWYGVVWCGGSSP
eukprot:COSAG06_NODE_32_length_31260_cov_54.706973_17_plen_53_part_00